MGNNLKILLLADSHLQLTNRIDDFVKSLYQVSEIASKEKVDKIYHLGDIYHKRQPHPKEQELMRKWIAQLPCPLKIFIGNHDINLDTHSINEFEIFKNMGVEIVRPPVIEDLDGKKIYFDHSLIEGAKLGPSNRILTNAHELSKQQLLNLKCTAYFFGHVHKYQVVQNTPPMIYVGSIDRIDFAERNEDKGVIILDTVTGKMKRHLLNIRPMLQIDIDLANPMEQLPTVLDGSIVKIVIKGTTSQINQFNIGIVKEAVNKSQSYKIFYEVTKTNKKIENKNISESNSPSDSFLEYCKVKKLNENTIKEGLKIINEYSVT